MEQEIIDNKKPSLFGVIWSPGEQLERIRQNPRILAALVIVTLLALAGSAVFASSITINDLGEVDIPEENLELVLKVTQITLIVVGLITPALGALFYSVIHLIIVAIAKKKVSFKQLFSMNIYISIIGALGLILNAVIQKLTGAPYDIFITSLAGVLDSQSPILAKFEVFSIWQLVLMAIGLHKVAQLSKGAAWTVAVVFFLISLGFAAISTLLSGVA